MASRHSGNLNRVGNCTNHSVPRCMEAAGMLNRKPRDGKRAAPRFAAPPWDREHPRWLELDQTLPADHVARQVVAALEDFDATELRASYSASGTPATDPVLMLRIVLIELRRGRFRPQHWYQDTQENDALKWA